MSTEELKKAINEILDERDAFDGRTHSDHHHFVEEMIAERKRKEERRERLRQQVVGWGIISTLSAMGYGTYHMFIEFVKKVSH